MVYFIFQHMMVEKNRVKRGENRGITEEETRLSTWIIGEGVLCLCAALTRLSPPPQRPHMEY